ncbi:DUF488 family protein [Chitinophaga sp. SYP-B3965]|uniref:DUF488 domain-containing protein n=1 Tax=Chitinophaga sp. SYP-B3965 TaxID=2663120 RepID=UPI00129952AE|nr:DUF488 family protein [Chitinophaga sp. SYP-B3965]MRG48797.1 DUF488 family protein [Chitinophaga sp. SYP-B3965]
MKPVIKIKRVYDEPSKEDGFRILIDRLWPRGFTKEKAAVDEWAKDLAPSSPLRTWFRHSEALWPEFEKKYLAELKKNAAVGDFIKQHKDKKKITLIFATKDLEHNHAIVLQKYLTGLF